MKNLFQAIDNKDTETFAGYLSANAKFRFGNAPEVHGRDNIVAVVNAFFNSVSSLSHTLTETWRPPGAVICHGMVTYTRLDNSSLTVPFCNVFKFEDGLIDEYLIYADVSTL